MFKAFCNVHFCMILYDMTYCTSSCLVTKLWIHGKYICMYVCMYVYMYVCMYVYIYVCIYVCMYVCMLLSAIANYVHLMFVTTKFVIFIYIL
jgi:nuclear pore complex protein Nup62